MDDQRGFRRLKIKSEVQGLSSYRLEIVEIGHAGLDVERLLVEL